VTAPPRGDEAVGGGEGGARDVTAHLQSAALELIAAVRAFLDAAEEVVRDPAGAVAVATTLAGRARGRRPPAGADDGEGDSAVQRIPVT
jgi:hypothetical protein